jgi:uncharacterized phage protein gp47/JayE
MARGKIDPPKLDDRTWQDLVNQAKALIPHYAPEWTDHNPSDLGITLVELFAWLVEQMIYRLNRVPEKNYVAFLNLLGITRDPAVPAATWVTFKISGDTPVAIRAGSQVSTQPSVSVESVIFETDEELIADPANLIAQFYTDEGVLVEAPPGLAGVRLHISGTSTGQNGSSRIVLGFDKKPADKIKLLVRLGQPLPKENQAAPTWQYLATSNNTITWNDMGDVDDQTAGFTRSGIISLPLPGDWTPQKLDEADNKVCCWVQMMIPRPSSGAAALELKLDHLLFNSVAATNALTIQEEELGKSDGTAYQHFELKRWPLYKQPPGRGGADPYGHLAIEVRESPDRNWETWEAREDLPAEKGGAFYRLNPVTGTIMFGDGKHGRIPPAGSEIRATAYRYVAGGLRGNVKADALTALYTPDLKADGVVEVSQLVDATGGSDEESVAEAKRRAPDMLRTRNRAVTLEDCEYLAREASTTVARVRALPPKTDMHGDGDLDRSPGKVNVIIIPNYPEGKQPTPSPELILEVTDYLDKRRLLTSHITVTHPRYLPIKVTVNIKKWPDAFVKTGIEDDSLINDLVKAIETFLHPLRGGLDGQGWQVGQNVMAADLLRVVQAKLDPAFGFIFSLTLSPEKERSDKSISEAVWVKLADYEIVCSGIHKVEIVDAE